MLATINYHGYRSRLRNPVKHLVCDEIQAVVPRLCVAGVWIGRRIKPAANLKFARPAIGPGALICAEDQFVDREIAINLVRKPLQSSVNVGDVQIDARLDGV